MRNKVKDQVLEFMQREDTSGMNNNEFIFEYYKTLTWDSILNEVQFRDLPSTESVSLSRRYITKIYWIGKRKNADTQKEYIDEFALQNKIHVI